MNNDSIKSKRQLQKEKRREQILDVALDLFIRRGYAATKISDIAKAADMSAGLMFHYFESKEKLYETLLELGISGPSNLMGSIPADDALKYFEIAAEQILKAVTEMPFVAKMFVLVYQAHHNEALPDALRQKLGMVNYYEMSSGMMAKGQQQGGIREGDPMALSVAYWTAIQGVAMAIALGIDVPAPESEWLVDIIRNKG